MYRTYALSQLNMHTHDHGCIQSLPDLKSFQYLSPGPGLFNQASDQDLGVQIMVSSYSQASPP